MVKSKIILAAGMSMLLSEAASATPALTASKLTKPVQTAKFDRTLHPTLSAAQGNVTIVVRLNGLPSARLGPMASKAISQIDGEQEAFLARCLQLDGVRFIARTKHVLNAVFLEVDAKHLEAIAEDPGVQRIAPVGNYDLVLAETVPYVGGTAVQNLGLDGTGVRVAVIDSGIDYTHIAFGGSGDPADWAANDPNVIEPGSFPTARVVGGYDFVGSVWPNGPTMPDPDPLDDGPAGGHGTHVADIIGGAIGMAPGVDLYAIKGCSSVSSSCDGVALIQGMDFAVDPDGDGDTSDAVDIINMSLGSNYGQPFDDDLSAAVENATALGVLTVASAGNGGDRPYVTGTPAAASSALSVAQTAVPSAALDQMEVIQPAVAAGNYNAVRQAWTPSPAAPVSGTVLYGDGAGGNLNGCAAFAPGTFAGDLVVVDRGACNFSDKIRNIENAGGSLGIIALVDGSAPFSGGFGGGSAINIPGYMISQADGNILRAGGAVVSFDPANQLPLAGSVISSSSRGPRNGDNQLKPEIGAPGASVSAEYGTGVGTTPFGGTSGAAPMVSGAAALVLEGRPGLNPIETKSFLMNYADTQVARDFTGTPAELSRTGAGELRVDAAVNGMMIAFERESWSPAISGNFVAASKARTVVRRSLRVRNFTGQARTANLTWSYRYPGNPTNAAVTVHAPSRVRVPPHTDRIINVRFAIDGNLLPNNSMGSGSNGTAPLDLTAMELSGFLHFDDGHEPFDVPWHILPRKSSNVTGNQILGFRSDGTANVNLRNRGVGAANAEIFGLAALSGQLPQGAPGTQAPTPDIRAVGVNTTPVPAGFCSGQDSFLWRFAFNSHEPQTQLLPVIFYADLDIDQDGSFDYEVINGDFGILTGGGIDGRNVSIVFDLATGAAGAFFFAEHATNTANTIVTVCGEQVGLTGTDLGTTAVNVEFGTFDYYFGGPGDTLPVTTIVPGGERYQGTVASPIAPSTTERMSVVDTGPTSNFPDLGLLLINNSDFGPGDRGGATPATEAMLFLGPNTSVP